MIQYQARQQPPTRPDAISSAYGKYRAVMKQVERLRRAMNHYEPDSAIGITLASAYADLEPVVERRATAYLLPQHSFNECEQCGRDYNDHACTHRRSEFYRDAEQ